MSESLYRGGSESVPKEQNPPNAPIQTCGCSKPKKLVVCIDGTTNKFGKYNSNVVQLYYALEKNDEQLTYYNSGIGTHINSSSRWWKRTIQSIDNWVDARIAWNFQRIILGAYRWLSDHYSPGDKIYLFGFSRGAYQVRVLGGMIHKVGLLQAGNEEQIPFAYKLYAKPNNAFMAARFKETFSREQAKVDFIGVWDSVSSVGLFRRENLPFTLEVHATRFRQALALHEYRVRYLPEYVCGGKSEPWSDKVQEVWFSGSHSDIGGGGTENENLNNTTVPWLWMKNQASEAGLKFRPTTLEREGWDFRKLQDEAPEHSLTPKWQLLEFFPERFRSYSEQKPFKWSLHRGEGRKVMTGQKIHASVCFVNPEHIPRATFASASGLDWTQFFGKGLHANPIKVDGAAVDVLDMDFFGFYSLQRFIQDPTCFNDEYIKRLSDIKQYKSGVDAILRVNDLTDGALSNKIVDKIIEDPPTMFDLSIDILQALLEADQTRILHFLMRPELVDALVRSFSNSSGKIPSSLASVLCKLAQSDCYGSHIITHANNLSLNRWNNDDCVELLFQLKDRGDFARHMREDGFLLLLDSPCSDSVKLGKNNVEWKMDKIANILWKLAEADTPHPIFHRYPVTEWLYDKMKNYSEYSEMKDYFEKSLKVLLNLATDVTSRRNLVPFYKGFIGLLQQPSQFDVIDMAALPILCELVIHEDSCSILLRSEYGLMEALEQLASVLASTPQDVDQASRMKEGAPNTPSPTVESPPMVDTAPALDPAPTPTLDHKPAFGSLPIVDPGPVLPTVDRSLSDVPPNTPVPLTSDTASPEALATSTLSEKPEEKRPSKVIKLVRRLSGKRLSWKIGDFFKAKSQGISIEKAKKMDRGQQVVFILLEKIIENHSSQLLLSIRQKPRIMQALENALAARPDGDEMKMKAEKILKALTEFPSADVELR